MCMTNLTFQSDFCESLGNFKICVQMVLICVSYCFVLIIYNNDVVPVPIPVPALVPVHYKLAHTFRTHLTALAVSESTASRQC